MDIAELSRHFDQRADAVQEALTKTAEKSAERAAAVEAQVGGLKHELFSLRQAGVRGGGGSFGTGVEHKSIGAQVVGSEALKAFAGITERPARARIETKTILSTDTSGGPLGRRRHSPRRSSCRSSVSRSAIWCGSCRSQAARLNFRG